MTTADLQPTLTGALLELRPLAAADFDELYTIASDPLLWEQHPASDRHKTHVFREFFRIALASGGAFAVIDRDSGAVIGSTRFHGYEEKDRVVEIGWTFLARTHWGGVYNREMKHLMLEHAFGFVSRVIFRIGAENFRSQRAVEKIGAVRTGACPDEHGEESFIYEISAAAFAGARRS